MLRNRSFYILIVCTYLLSFGVHPGFAQATGPNEKDVLINQNNLVDWIIPPVDPFNVTGSTMIIASVQKMIFIDYRDSLKAIHRFAVSPDWKNLENLKMGLSIIQNHVTSVKGTSKKGQVVCSQKFFIFMIGPQTYSLENSTFRRLGGDRVLPLSTNDFYQDEQATSCPWTVEWQNVFILICN